jgi:glycosyltransferase involved in cell wall biosynthesis
MFWEPFDYFQNESYGILNPIKKLSVFILSFPLSIIRVLDYFASKKVDFFISNSITAQKRIKKYYDIESKIIYPFVHLENLSKQTTCSKDNKINEGYFLIITRLVSWKKVELAIKACEELGVNLKIIGEGPDKDRLISMSGLNTSFLGFVDERTKIDLLQGCKALINTQIEDFGIVPLEALTCGKPVIAYGKGGVLETIEPGVTGEFFYEQTSDSLKELLVKFDGNKYNPEACIEKSKVFDKEKFKKELFDLINNVYL